MCYTAQSSHDLVACGRAQAIHLEDKHNQQLPGELRQGSQMTDGHHAHARNTAECTGFRQRDYLKPYLNSPAGSVDCQQNMIWLLTLVIYSSTYNNTKLYYIKRHKS